MKRLAPVLAIVLLLAASCKGKGPAEPERQTVSGVTLSAVSLVERPSYYETTGTVRARAVSPIAARTMAAVVSVPVKEGDRVRRGQLLVALDDRDAAQRVTGAESGYRAAQRAAEEAGQQKALSDLTYGRYRNLAEEKVISRQEMDEVETRKRVADLGYERAGEMVAGARARLEEARIGRGFTRIVAPHDGVITEKRVEPGAMAVPGTPLLTLEDTSLFKVEAYVNEGLMGKVTWGTPVRVVLAGGRTAAGAVGEVVPAVDPATRSFPVKIYLADHSLKSGVYVRVLIPEGAKRVLLVPARSLVGKGQLTGLYVVDGQGIMTYRIVRTGQAYGDEVEVVSGLRPDERIAVAGIEHAVDGGVVR